MAGIFCKSCGKKNMETDVFCTFCGEKRMIMIEEQPQNIEQPMLTLMDFQSKKTEERTSRFSKKKKSLGNVIEEFCPKKNKPSTKSTESVLINVGIIRENEKDGNLCIVRGSKLPIHVPRQANADTVHKFAIEKHTHYDQFFCGLEDWTLLYPDQKKVDIIPGTKMHFNVERYKRNLQNLFQKLTCTYA